MDFQPQFIDFLKGVEQTEFEINTTATGAQTIQQSRRNILRKEGIAALKADLEWLYGGEFDIVETKDGLVIVAENEPGDFTFSWEIKSTIKSIDYDPFIEANAYEEEELAKTEKKLLKEQEKQQKLSELEAKRLRKLQELELKKK